MKTCPEILKKLFPGESSKELSKIWEFVYSPELSSIMNRPTINIMQLDALLIAKYGEYEGSMKDFIGKNFGEDIANDFNELITI